MYSGESKWVGAEGCNEMKTIEDGARAVVEVGGGKWWWEAREPILRWILSRVESRLFVFNIARVFLGESS